MESNRTTFDFFHDSFFFFLFFFFSSSQKTTRSSPPPSSSFDTFPKSLALGINFLKSHFLFSFSFLLLLLFCSLHSHFFLLSFSMISSIILMSLFSSYQNSPTKRYFLLSHPFFLFFSFLFFSFLSFPFLSFSFSTDLNEKPNSMFILCTPFCIQVQQVVHFIFNLLFFLPNFFSPFPHLKHNSKYFSFSFFLFPWFLPIRKNG